MLAHGARSSGRTIAGAGSFLSAIGSVCVCLAWSMGIAVGQNQKPDRLEPGSLSDVTDRERFDRLSPQTEKRYDEIIEAFILHDLGVKRDNAAVRRFRELDELAIVPLVRAMNRTARLSHSCPVAALHRKIKEIVRASLDEELLEFVRLNAGAGVGPSPYQGLFNDLKVTAMVRKRQLYDQRAEELKRARKYSSDKSHLRGFDR
ncbi:MAG: hypothetical protein C4297_05290 [Gemmataceae bacterium]